MKRHRTIPLICLGLCLLITTVFAVNVLVSRQAIPTVLVDDFGDTGGIRSLTIQGIIVGGASDYAYAFNLGPRGNGNRLTVHNSAEDYVSNSRYNHLYYSETEVMFLPAGETKEEVVDNNPSDDSVRNSWDSLYGVHRIYADYFEVIPRYQATGIPIRTDPNKEKLYYRPDKGHYVYAQTYVDGARHPPEYYKPSFNVSRTQYREGLTVGDQHFMVVTGTGYYGHTAVYVVDTTGGHVPTVQGKEDDRQVYIIAEELYPIELTEDDTIMGLVELQDGFLLVIQRSGYFELTRIDPDSGRHTTVVGEGAIRLEDCLVSEDSFVAMNISSAETYPEIHGFDLSDGCLELVMSVSSVPLQRGRSDGIYYDISSAILKDGILYAATVAKSMPDNPGPGEVQITALDQTGQLIGSCKLLCGYEEDYHYFWQKDMGIIPSESARWVIDIQLTANE